MSLTEFLDGTSTDAFLVVHAGRIVFERYFGDGGPDTRHVLMSVSKSIGAMAAGCLVTDGLLELSESVSFLVPELATSAYGSASISQLLDMTAALRFSQEYEDPTSEVQAQDRAAGWRPRIDGDAEDSRSFLATLRPAGNHGEEFQYCSATTDVLAWVLERAAKTHYGELLSDRVWSRIGAENDAIVSVDRAGNPYACAGIAATARDLVRFGLCVLDDRRALGAQVFSSALIDATRHGGSRAAIEGHADFAALHDAGTYRNQWWVTGDERGTLIARGIFGQYLWLDPLNDVAIVKFSSQPGPLDDYVAHDVALAQISTLVAESR
ncbi:MAG: serine hydrolase domain-containing protein [Acidimicrobiales bacterium]